MEQARRIAPFPLRLREEVRGEAEAEASKNRRSLNSEISLLVEEGLACRKQKSQSQK
ncbi:TPA: Arc family DNA-binding protein [Pseudomonas aeruginosa]|nr:Arc family DNA-binding protein [Pseudomonas aeruginosa]